MKFSKVSQSTKDNFKQGFWWVIGGSVGYFVIQPVLNFVVAVFGGIIDIVSLMNFLKTGTM